jgi:hypothetical protein
MTLPFLFLGFSCVSFPTDIQAVSLGLRIPVYLYAQPFFAVDITLCGRTYDYYIKYNIQHI